MTTEKSGFYTVTAKNKPGTPRLTPLVYQYGYVGDDYMGARDLAYDHALALSELGLEVKLTLETTTVETLITP